MKKLLSRAPFCPIGVKSNIRITVNTFIKMCKHHQSLGAGSLKGREGASLIHAVACDVCPVGPRIVRNEDPVLVVGDIEWITFNEVQEIQKRVSGIVSEINKFTKRQIKNRGKKQMRDNLLKLQELVKRIEIILSEMLQDGSADYVPAEKEVVVKTKEPEKVTTTNEEVRKSKKKDIPTSKTVELSKKLYELEKAGKSRAFLSTEYKLSKKYIGTLVRRYAASLGK